MTSPKTTQVLFGTVALLFIFTLVAHLSYADKDAADDSQTYTGSGFTAKLTNQLKPYMQGTSHLPTLQQHLSRSEEQYQAMIKQRPGLMADYEDQNQKPLFPCTDTQKYWKTPFSIWDFVPASFNCPHSIIRLGRLGDGGKWLCGLEKHFALPPSHRSEGIESSLALTAPTSEEGKQPGCIIYSFGIQVESSFEEEMLQRTPHCQVWGYDFSVTQFGPQLKDVESSGRAHFTQAGIAGVTNTAKDPPFYSIQDIMSMNGHDHIDVLKMDIEGWEFQSMTSLIKFFKAQGKEIPVAQFIVELHLFPQTLSTDEFMSWWELMESAGFRPVWTEPNLLVTTMKFHDGMPRYAEYTFINIQDSRSPLLR